MTRGSRRGVGAFALLAAAALAATVAATALASSVRRQDTVTLRVLMPTTLQTSQDIIDKNFERVYPNIQIDAQYLSSTVLRPLLLAQLQAGNAPDLFVVQGANGTNGVWPLADAGRLLDLTGRKWQSRIFPRSRPMVTWKGKVYAWMPLVIPYAVFYNADLFKQLNLKVPAKFSDLLALCKQITAAGKVPFAQAFGDPIGGGIVGKVVYANFVYDIDPSWDAKRAKKQVSFAASPLWHRALQAIVDMKDASCFQPGVQGTARPQAYGWLARGDAVMSIVAATELTPIRALNPNLHFLSFNLPSDKAGQGQVFVNANQSIAGNAATKYPAQVKTFIDFMAREQQSSLYARVADSISPLDVKKEILPAAVKPLGPLLRGGGYVGGIDERWPSGLIAAAYQEGINGLFTGQTTIDGLLGKMDQLWDNPS